MPQGHIQMKNKTLYFLLPSSIFISNISSAYDQNGNRSKRSVTWSKANASLDFIASNNSKLCSLKNSSLFCFDLYKDGSRLPPNEIQIPGSYKYVSMGQDHICAIEKTNGFVTCWGDNSYGQLGNGTLNPAMLPQRISANKAFEFVSASIRDTYAIDSQGLLWGWGHNPIGQQTNQNIPKQILLPNKTFFSVAAGEDFFCAITKEGQNGSGFFGKIYCAGKNNDAQFVTDPNQNIMPHFTKVSEKNYLTMSAAKSHVCAITTEQKVECWGNNYLGQLSYDPILYPHISSPQPIIHNTDKLFAQLTFKSLALSDEATCAITTKGIPYCFGNNSFGQLGGNPLTGSKIIKDNFGNQYYSHFTPKVPIANLTYSFLQLTGNKYSTCGITQDKNLQCWGFIEKNTYKSISVGNGSFCGISAVANRAFCSGSENGLASTLANPWNSPLVTPWASTQPFIQVSSGLFQTCGVTSEQGSNTYCWPNPKTAYLQNVLFPQRVAALNEENSKIIVGAQHSCAIRKKDGALFCSGDNGQGQLGNGTTTGSMRVTEYSQVKLPGVSFIDIALTDKSTCAISNANDVYCFGSNDNGELGIGSPFLYPKLTPQKIGNLKLKSITGGLNHYCGILNNATGKQNKVVCWGSNKEGQVGQSNRGKIIKPTEIANSQKVTSVSAKKETSCMLDSENKTFCFGSNYEGIIAQRPQEALAHVPFQIEKDKKFKVISLGNADACGISLLDHTVSCWGGNR